MLHLSSGPWLLLVFVRMSLLPFPDDCFDDVRIERAPVFFVADHWHIRKERTRWALLSATQHEFAEAFSNCLGECSQLIHKVWIVARDVRAFGDIRVQVV